MREKITTYYLFNTATHDIICITSKVNCCLKYRGIPKKPSPEQICRQIGLDLSK